MLSIREKASHADSLQKEEKINGFLSFLVAKIVELQSSLEIEKKSQKEATTTVAEMESCVDEVA